MSSACMGPHSLDYLNPWTPWDLSLSGSFNKTAGEMEQRAQLVWWDGGTKLWGNRRSLCVSYLYTVCIDISRAKTDTEKLRKLLVSSRGVTLTVSLAL